MSRGGARLGAGPKPKGVSTELEMYTGELPECPEYLTADAVAKVTWSKTVQLLAESGLLPKVDLAVLEQYCFACAYVRKLQTELLGGTYDPRKAEQVNKYMTQIRQLSCLLGLDPTSKAKFGVKAKQKEKDGLEDFLSESD